MRMTFSQFNGFLTAVGRDEKRRFADRAAATRIGMAEDKSYRQIMDKLDND